MVESLDQLILSTIDQKGSVDTAALAKEQSRDHQALVGAVKRLQSLGEVCLMSFHI